jgi:hypothetical protein
MAARKFKHKPEYDIFPNEPEKLALEALRAGLTPEKFARKYLSSLNDARTWNTASEFIATINAVNPEKIGNNMLMAVVEYEVRAGTPNSDEKSIRIGIIDQQANPEEPDYARKYPLNALATKAKGMVGKKAKITKVYVYSAKDDSDYAVLKDIELIPNQ